MRVLWITNPIFAEPSRALNLGVPVTGGWLYGLADDLADRSDLDLAVASVYPGRALRRFGSGTIDYFVLPAHRRDGYPESLERHWRNIFDLWKPDIVHIHGTEYPNGLSCLRALPSLPHVVSLQGLTGVCARYHYGGIDPRVLMKYRTIRDVVRNDSVSRSHARRVLNGRFEEACIRSATVVLGRTSWDELHARAIAPAVDYRHCGERLRDSFYASPKWSRGAVSEHSIFASQGHTPLKGLHMALRAMALLVDEFPSITLRVGGNNILNARSLRSRLRRTGYAKYLASLIGELGLEDRIEFTGWLDESAMSEEYLRAHVFVCPSSIENSPNSLAEAQLLGVPTIASRVGGIPDMVRGGRSGLMYRFEEYEALAHSIRQVFQSDQLAARLSDGAIAEATQRHDTARAAAATHAVYQELVSRRG